MLTKYASIAHACFKRESIVPASCMQHAYSTIPLHYFDQEFSLVSVRVWSDKKIKP